ncbi:nuclear distribution protein RO10 [Pseudovirgaria hyperparasitica]|uniref:Nuclear distribution protein RO10 n=1 Tax=Pseudovirgaria hyperparasitica TaxID=470096 RepID=A0A6A6W8W9_9PEZI|nr:nuclear distribution protein RO10 [Pseudovirgaria hyperparasitica]KAF2758336.1 nuclear distribution protein RO10 [Pseudovirgaria hyperparasitica]
MTTGEEDVILDTLDLLEWRMRRVQFVLDGDLSLPTGWQKDVPILKRVQKLEHALRRLTEQSGPVYEILKLYSRYPELFQDAKEKDLAPELDIQQKLALVELEAPKFHATASQLTSLSDVPLPPLKSFASLVSLEPRIAQIEQRQLEQAREISELQKRSGILVYRWNETLVLSQGRCWVEYDKRLRQAERSVRRKEIRKSA